MSITEVVDVQESTFKFSFDGKFVVYAFQNNVFIGNSSNRKVVRCFPALNCVECFHWSPDSKFVLCGLYQCGVIEIISIQFPKWKCRIKEGEIGIKHAMWSPDSKHVLTVGNFNVSVCIWSLSDLSVRYIYNLVSSLSPVMEFSCNGKWLVAVEKSDNLFSVVVFSSASWELVNSWSISDIEIPGGLSWSPDSSTVSIWEQRVDICRVQFFTPGCDRMHTFEKDSLGVKCLQWAPSGQLVALGCYDGKVRVLNHLTWSELIVISHDKNIFSPSCSAYKESLLTEFYRMNDRPSETVFAELVERPIIISSLSEDCPDTRYYGISVCQFSACGQFLATNDSNVPSALWVWNVHSGTLHVFLAFRQPVLGVRWNPGTASIVVVSKSANICVWNPLRGASTIRVPQLDVVDGCTTGLEWHPEGDILAISVGTTVTFLCFSEETKTG